MSDLTFQSIARIYHQTAADMGYVDIFGYPVSILTLALFGALVLIVSYFPKMIIAFIKRGRLNRRRIRNRKPREDREVIEKRSIRRNVAGLFKSLSGYDSDEDKHIPDRIIEDIKLQQDHSEIFVALLQIVLTLVFAGLYAYAEMRDGEELQLRSTVPMLLGFYLVFGVVRLTYALSAHMPLFLLVAGLAADFGILALMIVLLESEALVALAFIFIALRTFRFQPIWVFSAGLCAIPAILVPYLLQEEATVLGSMQQQILTILALAAVTVTLMISQMMAKRNLFKSALSEMAREDLSHFFDEDVVRKITTQMEGPSLAIAETRLSTIMFIDMRGFSKASAELSAEQVVTLIKQVQSIIVPIIRAHGGSIDKFMGDGILASFGAVTDRPDHARDALEAALKIVRDYGSWLKYEKKKDAPGLDIGIGIASGEIVYGIIGDPQRYEYTVIGDAVNTAAKLEKQTKMFRLKMLCDARTAALAGEQGFGRDLNALENIEVEGLSGLVTVYSFMKEDVGV